MGELKFQVVVDKTLPSVCSQAVSFDTGESKQEVGSGLFAYSGRGAIVAFHEALLLGAPFPFTFHAHALRKVGTLVAVALFIYRDLLLSPGTHALVAGVDFYDRVGETALAHLPEDHGALIRTLASQLVNIPSEEEAGNRVSASVAFIREYLLEDTLPHTGSKVLPTVITVGSNGFVVAETPTKPSMGAWVELFRQGHLRGVIWGQEQEGLRHVLFVSKSTYLTFDLAKGAILFNELEALHGRETGWRAVGLSLLSPERGTVLTPAILLEVAVRLLAWFSPCVEV